VETVDIGWIARKEAAMDTLVLVAWVALACYVISASLRWLLEGSAPRPLQSLVRLAERRRRAASLPSSATVVLLELELQRIAERLQQEYVSPQPAKAERVRGWMIAYDRVLIELCESSSVTPPRQHHRLPLSAEERFTVEHSLVGSGRSW
jgi:hypothetical protein